MDSPLSITTERENVILRQLASEADDLAYYDAYNFSRAEVEAFDPPESRGKYKTLDQVREARLNPADEHRLRLGIWDGDSFVGSINLTPDEDGAEIGYWLDSRHTGHGYATLATKALTAYALQRFPKVHADVVDGNDASVHVLERSGFYQTALKAGKLIFEAKLPEQAEPVNLHEVTALQDVKVREGIVLRPLEVSDAARILEILAADASIRDRVSVASRMHTPEDVEEQVESYKKDKHLIRYAIVEAGKPIGLVSFWRDVDNSFDAPDAPDDYGFGYFLDPAKRGRGIVTDAVRAIMDVAAKNIQVDQFIAYCEDNNPDSIAVLTKLGFQPTDTVLVEQTTGWTERKYVREPVKV